jgi:hypothetical protein
VCLEASTKPHVHQKFEIFWTNIASIMACPMSKNGPKKSLRPLGVNFKFLLINTHKISEWNKMIKDKLQHWNSFINFNL